MTTSPSKRQRPASVGGDAHMNDHDHRYIVAGLYALWIVAMALIAVAFMMAFSS
jgi:hypothetical protein